MQSRSKKDPRTKKRWVVILIGNNFKHRSKSRKTEAGAWKLREALLKRCGLLGYTAEVEEIEEMV